MRRNDKHVLWDYTAVDDESAFAAKPTVGGVHQRPMTEMQALMEAKPHEDPLPAQETLLALRDVLADAIDRLPELERDVFEACVIRRASLREYASEIGLSKSGIAKIRDRACALLQADLTQHSAIKEYLDG